MKKEFGFGFEKYQNEYTRPCYECGLQTQRTFKVIHKYIPLCSNCTQNANRPTSEYLSKTIKEGLKRAKKAGVVLGRPATVDYSYVAEVYKELGNMRATAKQCGVGLGTVSNAVKAMKELEQN